MQTSLSYRPSPLRLLTVPLMALGLTLALLWTLQPIRIARAQTFTVTKTEDSADGVCDEDCSLREAIIAANESEGPDTIVLGPGHYLLTLSGNNEDLGATGDLDITSDMTIQGTGAAQTIIDAGGFITENRDRVLHIRWQQASSAISPTVMISGVTVQNGYADYGPGGGIYIDQAAVEIQNSTVQSNSVANDHNGGGVETAAAVLTIRNSVIENNTATSDGGGIHSIGDSQFISTVISGNIATRMGGGLYIVGDNHKITDSLIANNSAGEEGGGVWSETVDIVRSTVRNNRAPKGGGLALYDSQIVESTISNNTAQDSGGGVYIPWSFGPLEIHNSTLSGNSAGRGGALATNREKGAKVSLFNTTIAANKAITEGAGIFHMIDFFDPSSYLTLKNVLLADNDGENCAGSVNNITSLGHNLSDDGFCSFTAAGDQVKVDAKLGPLADNGGPTLTHALFDDSPAIHAGDDSACPTTDQRGISRPQGPGCDIGAFEAVVTTPYLIVKPATLTFNAVAGANSPPAQVFTVTNSGVDDLNWNASESTDWLSLDKTGGTAPMTVSVAVDTNGLTHGSYSGNVTVSADGAGGSPQTVAVSLTVLHPSFLLLNGDFELGHMHWTEASLKSRPLIRQGNDVPFTSPRSGQWAGVLGQVNGEISDLAQTVILPDGDDLSLIYYTYGHSDESQCDVEAARVRIDGLQVATHPLCQANNSSEWTMQQINLNAYRGQEVTLHFYLANDPTSHPSTLLIDDVRLQLGDQPPPQTQWEIFLPAIHRQEMPVINVCVPSASGESNNVGDALTICSDQTVNGAVNDGDRWDVYKIDIDANRFVVIELSGSTGDADLLLFPSHVTDVSQDVPAYYSAWTNTSNELIRGTTLVGGDWYVAINAYAGSTEYQLKATIGEVVAPLVCTPDPAGESNNVNDALTVCSDQPVSGEVSGSDQWDVYRIHFADNTGMRFDLSGSGGDAAIGLYGPSATDVVQESPIRVSHTPGTNDERIVGIIRDPGGWYVAVRSFAIEATNYTLRATALFVGEESAGRERREQRDLSGFDLNAQTPSAKIRWD